jgi:hypothetical protein
MNTNKYLKPNLLDPIIEKKIIKTLKPQVEDYWAPTKNGFRTFYENYIRPNYFLIIFIVLILLFLIYRYRIIKKRRENTEPDKDFISPPNKINTNSGNNKNSPNKDIDEYTKLLMHMYNQQKEEMREPPIKHLNDNTNPKFAYPMYPYAQGGTLAPSTNK